MRASAVVNYQAMVAPAPCGGAGTRIGFEQNPGMLEGAGDVVFGGQAVQGPGLPRQCCSGFFARVETELHAPSMPGRIRSVRPRGDELPALAEAGGE
jgi:hypothetical protein